MALFPEKLRIGVLTRPVEHFSLRYYREKVVGELMRRGVEIIHFDEDGPLLPPCGVIWDPGGGMRMLPLLLLKTELPVVITVHGLRAFFLPPEDFESEPGLPALREDLRTAWQSFSEKVRAVITVSRFGAQEVIGAFNLLPELVYPIYHGVDPVVFSPEGETHSQPRPYFLSVSLYQPKKNLERILAAYDLLNKDTRPDLVVVAPGYAGDRSIFVREGVRFSDAMLSHKELAGLFRGALCFVFPSLHETFGLSIIEAMACGCPVITSRTTACSEIAADAALLVDPYSVDDIADALRRCSDDPALRTRLASRGMERARLFTWERCAEEHLNVFLKFGGAA